MYYGSGVAKIMCVSMCFNYWGYFGFKLLYRGSNLSSQTLHCVAYTHCMNHKYGRYHITKKGGLSTLLGNNAYLIEEISMG